MVSYLCMDIDSGRHRGDVARRPEVKRKFDWSFFKRFELTPKEAEARRPRALDFEHVTLDDRVNADKYLLRLKARHARYGDEARHRGEVNPDQPTGTAFEEFFVEAIRDGRWFDSEFFRTTEHDDRWNGVDAVIEWPAASADEKPVRLAIDFSSSNSEDTLREKLQTINGMAKLKYFRSPTEVDGTGKPLEVRTFFPKVILGADVDLMKQIARDGVMPGREHPLRLLLLRQAKKQIDVQIRRSADHFLNQTWKEDDVPPEAYEVCRQIHIAPNPDALAEVMRNAPVTAFAKLFHKNQKQYLDECLRVKAHLDPLVQATKEQKIPEPWNTMSEVSRNHQMLSKTKPSDLVASNKY